MMLSRSVLFLSYFITDFCMASTFLPMFLLLIWYFEYISWISLFLSILILPAFFNISRCSMEHQFFGVKENFNSADHIIKSISLSVGWMVQHLWWALFGTPDNTSALSFLGCQASTFLFGMGIQLIGLRSLSDCGYTIDSSNKTAQGSVSL